MHLSKRKAQTANELTQKSIFANVFQYVKEHGRLRKPVKSAYSHIVQITPPVRQPHYLRVAVHAQRVINHTILLEVNNTGNLSLKLLELPVSHHTLKNAEVRTHTIPFEKFPHLLASFVVCHIVGHNTKILIRTHIHHFAIYGL